MSKIQGSETIILTTRTTTGEENSYGEIVYTTSQILVHNCLLFPGTNDIDFQRLGENSEVDYTVYLPRGYRQLSGENILQIEVRGEQFVLVKTVREYIPRKNSRIKPTQTLFIKRVENFGGTSNN